MIDISWWNLLLAAIIGFFIGVAVSANSYSRKLQKVVKDYDNLLQEIAEYYQLLLVEDI